MPVKVLGEKFESVLAHSVVEVEFALVLLEDLFCGVHPLALDSSYLYYSSASANEYQGLI